MITAGPALPKLSVTYSMDLVLFATEVLGVRLETKQAELLKLASGPQGKRVIFNCSRQWGKSTVGSILATHTALFQNESEVVVVSPALKQSGLFLKKVRKHMQTMGITPRGDGANQQSAVFPNGSRIVGLPADEDTGRGFSSVALLLVDEASRVSDEVYFSMKPSTISSHGGLWLMSTPNGQRGFFYKAWREAGIWTRVKGPATECPRFSAAQLEEDLRAMGERWFRQEYLCEFGDYEQSAFRREAIERAMRADLAPLDLKAWCAPGGPVCFLGVDFGQRRDYSAIVGLEAAKREVGRNAVTFQMEERAFYETRLAERFPLDTPYTEVLGRVREIVTSGPLRGRCHVVVDATGLGGPLLEMLKEMAGKERMWGKIHGVTITGGGKAHGRGLDWNVPKRDLIQAVDSMLTSGELGIAAGLREAEALREELADLEVTVTESGHERFGARGGGHDDLAMGLALACWGAKMLK